MQESSIPAKDGFQSMPVELKKRIVQFLTMKEAGRLSQTSKRVHSDLALSFLRRVQIVKDAQHNGGVHDGDKPRRSRILSIPDPHLTHSVLLEGKFWDQGWGNRKGQVFVYSHALDVDQDTIATGRRVAVSPVALHKPNKLKLSFHPQPDRVYSLWYRVGGGGGHQLHLRDIYGHIFVHKDGCS